LSHPKAINYEALLIVLLLVKDHANAEKGLSSEFGIGFHRNIFLEIFYQREVIVEGQETFLRVLTGFAAYLAYEIQEFYVRVDSKAFTV
jgi:hypothetical protein